ncbi:rRNA maturation RNase YbeY [Alkalicoccus luteus]|uniref:Endoribonuclease YbeY n=1 Tax=Alkalicoccus luteus TaxID=1237094 RepID=A0A969PLP0_9BACI|nr:rRNA maturation RNase YbeY [Alkalicoccus luteus]NJP36491.1 rRNA maturation RNase YbeY [Alkalicoccus luteus]
MSWTIDIYDETNRLDDALLQTLENVLETACSSESVPEEAELSVTFTGDAQIRKLNREFRNKDTATDVLSFPMEEEAAFFPEEMPLMLGDIIISVDTAVRQAEEYGHSLEREICFLAVHGFLHLNGYVHDTEQAEQQMIEKQKDILHQHGIQK